MPIFDKQRSEHIEYVHQNSLDENGVLQTVLIKQHCDSPQKGLKASDYSLRNIIDAEAVDLLKPQNPISRSTLDTLSQVDKGFESIDKSIE